MRSPGYLGLRFRRDSELNGKIYESHAMDCEWLYLTDITQSCFA